MTMKNQSPVKRLEIGPGREGNDRQSPLVRSPQHKEYWNTPIYGSSPSQKELDLLNNDFSEMVTTQGRKRDDREMYTND